MVPLVPPPVVVPGGGGGAEERATCPRISPAGFFAVWTFTYAPPASSPVTVLPFSFAVPRAPDRHGPHNDTATAPALPRWPRWTCEAVALPLSPWKVSRQERVPPVPLRIRPAANVPRAAAVARGRGTSWDALSFALRLSVVASAPACPAPLSPIQTPAVNMAVITAAPATRLRIPISPLLRSLTAVGLRTVRPALRADTTRVRACIVTTCGAQAWRGRWSVSCSFRSRCR